MFHVVQQGMRRTPGVVQLGMAGQEAWEGHFHTKEKKMAHLATWS